MALNGRLEDLNLLEILQIVAFAKKTGTLKVEGTMGSGAVLFREGVVLCAFSTSTTPVVTPLAGRTLNESRAMLLKDEIRVALRELVSLREGRFEFVISSETPTHFEGMDVRQFLLTDGVDPQGLMLELARELDIARNASSSLLESSEEVPAQDDEDARPVSTRSPLKTTGLTVVIVDDETEVLEVVAAELEAAGCTVKTASSAAEGFGLIDWAVASGRLLALVTDIAMPSSSGDSFQGGFEVIEHLKESNRDAPALLMTESLSSEARSKARKLGVRKVAFKPALTKLDADEYRADLESFAGIVCHELGALLEQEESGDVGSADGGLNHDVMFNFLKTMTAQLTNPTNGIARMILRVGAKYCERAVLFVVKGPKAMGLAALREGRPAKQATEEARGLAFDLQEVRAVAEAVYSREMVHSSHELDPLPPEIEPGRASYYVLLPLLHNHEVLSILLCDNPNTNKPLGNLSGLALFMVQAGMAMENASLQRKLKSRESQFSIDNQGPLTLEQAQAIGESQ